LDDNGSSCVLCGDNDEVPRHLFITCNFVRHACYKVFNWLGWELTMPKDLFNLFVIFGSYAGGMFEVGFCMAKYELVYSLFISPVMIFFFCKTVTIELIGR
jgi:membrane glycosyltransferase